MSLITTEAWSVVGQKLLRLCRIIVLLPPAMAMLIGMRLLRPWLLIRINPLVSSRLGHFAANTELYLCELDAGLVPPASRYIDLCYHNGRIANEQLAIMWQRCMRIWPAWLLGPVLRLNRLLPGGAIHEVGTNTQHDRDVHNLFERIPPHLRFTPEEELRGRAELRAIGIPDGAEFICLVARDNAYLKAMAPGGNADYYDYHDYRDANIENYVQAAEALAERGYYVLRMGAVVNAPLTSRHPGVIDYATNGMRNDFMDIYLGAHCLFCLSVGTGFDAVPVIFRRPVAYVNFLPVGYLPTYLKDSISICKRFWLTSERRFLSLREIFSDGVGFCTRTSNYDAHCVEVLENTPEEIKSLVIEMVERLKGTWRSEPDDDALQTRFWQQFPIDARDEARNVPLHGEIRSRYGAQFLRDNREWLE